MLTFWFWTAAAWTSGVLVGAALASALKEQDADLVIHEQVTATVEELPAEEDEVDNREAFADVERN